MDCMGEGLKSIQGLSIGIRFFEAIKESLCSLEWSTVNFESAFTN
jgi:hypothetical protein